MKQALAAAALSAGLMTASMTLAQPMTAAPPPMTGPADAGPQPGIPSSAAVDPAPGAAGPYVGHSEPAFYDVEARIQRVADRVKAQPPSSGKRRAMAEIASIRSELATQKARHGDVRDWDREKLNTRLDKLEQQYAGAQPAAAQ